MFLFLLFHVVFALCFVFFKIAVLAFKVLSDAGDDVV